MEIIHFATAHAFDFFAYLLLVGSLLITAAEVRHLVKSQRVSNLLTITRDHRDIWSELYTRPELARVLEPRPTLSVHPITNTEALFVTFVILHLKASYKARSEKMLITAEALEKDVRWFFSLPIPHAVWEQSKTFQDAVFADFVERATKGE